jgi:hypothetical protein
MTTFKTTLVTAVAVALSVTALASPSAFAKVLPAVQNLAPTNRTNPVGVQGSTVFTPGVQGASGSFAPSHPSASAPPRPVCGTYPGQCG